MAEPWKVEYRPGGWVIAERVCSDGAIERHRFAVNESRGITSANVEGVLYRIEHRDTATSASGVTEATSSGPVLADSAAFSAEFPGRLKKVLVAEGDQVHKGDSLFVLEAMKMEFDIKSPVSGRIAKLHVTVGQNMNPGDRFLDWGVH